MPRILIVEDEELQRVLLGRHFRAKNYDVVCAADAVEALHALLCEPFDLILSDIRMPYLDGIEFLQAVRGDVRTNNVPVVFLTGKSDAETRRKAILEGATAFLAKPCALAVVEGTIAGVLQRTALLASVELELMPKSRASRRPWPLGSAASPN
jgi:CheY-like chemotaxis protein